MNYEQPDAAQNAKDALCKPATAAPRPRYFQDQYLRTTNKRLNQIHVIYKCGLGVICLSYAVNWYFDLGRRLRKIFIISTRKPTNGQMNQQQCSRWSFWMWQFFTRTLKKAVKVVSHGIRWSISSCHSPFCNTLSRASKSATFVWALIRSGPYRFVFILKENAPTVSDICKIINSAMLLEVNLLFTGRYSSANTTGVLIKWCLATVPLTTGSRRVISPSEQFSFVYFVD